MRHEEATMEAIHGKDDGLTAFLRIRPRLKSIAYRIVGSAADAEDVVQDVWVRWQATDMSLVRDADAFLVTMARRLAINVIHSARSRYETRGKEPVDFGAGPGWDAERGQAFSLGIQVLVETLTPRECVAYVLREAFDHPYRDIARILRLEEANARQVVARARQHVARGRRAPARSGQQRRHRDALAELEALLLSGAQMGRAA